MLAAVFENLDRDEGRRGWLWVHDVWNTGTAAVLFIGLLKTGLDLVSSGTLLIQLL